MLLDDDQGATDMDLSRRGGPLWSQPCSAGRWAGAITWLAAEMP